MLSLILAATLPFVFREQDAALAFRSAKTLVEECTPRDAGTVRGQIAANRIFAMASATGVDVRRDVFTARTPRGERWFMNVTAERSDGRGGPWVVVVSHYDTKTGVDCPGANDGASTSGLLVALAKMLADRPDVRGNILLVWTDGEECFDSYSTDDGLWGSKRAAERLVREGRDVQAVICLDMLGDADLAITVPRNVSPDLAKIAVRAAETSGQPELVTCVQELVKDDHVPFLERGFKAIDLIDFKYGSTQDGNEYWHTKADTMDKVSERSLLASGRLVAAMLEILIP